MHLFVGGGWSYGSGDLLLIFVRTIRFVVGDVQKCKIGSGGGYSQIGVRNRIMPPLLLECWSFDGGEARFPKSVQVLNSLQDQALNSAHHAIGFI